MRKILQFRKWLSQYQELFYLPFILVMGGVMSFGLTSESEVYLRLFVATTLILGIKLVLTDYTWKELFAIGVIGILLAVNFLVNGEKTLIITFLGIVGAKNVDFGKAFRLALWSKLGLTLLRIDLVLAGVVENQIRGLPKNGEMHQIGCYGYYHPNMLYINLITIVFFAVLGYREKLKWYGYLFFSLVLFGAYKILYCRTGMVIWVVFCALLAGLWLASKIRLDKLYMKLCTVIPLCMAILPYILVRWAEKDEKVSAMLNKYLTSRIQIISGHMEEIKSLYPGNTPRVPFDILYFHMPYNYGWLLTMIFLFAYCATMWYCMKKGKRYEVVVLSAMAVYGFMEMAVLSVGWNLPLILLSYVLFQGEKAINERVQQEISDH